MPLPARRFIIGGILTVMLGSCGMIDGQRDGGFRAGRPLPLGSPVADFPVKIGAPYRIGAVTYTPADIQDYQAFGHASWYGEELNGNRTANGERFEAAGISAAHRTLPLPSYVEVTALSNGKTILLRINDRGPFTQDREIDLSRGAAEQLGILGSGATAVRVRRVEPPESERVALRSGRRVADRPTVTGPALAAIRQRAGVASPEPQVISAVRPLASLRNNGFYTVQVATFIAKERAEALAARINARVIPDGAVWHVSYGPYTNAGNARAGVTYAASKGFRDAIIIANDDMPAAPSR